VPEVYDPLTDPAPAHDVRAVLRIRAFRRLWIAFGLSSLGDWIGLLALTAMAKSFAGDDYQAANFACCRPW
jgi:dTMP kinase